MAVVVGALVGLACLSIEQSRTVANRKSDFVASASADVPRLQASFDSALTAVRGIEVVPPVDARAFELAANHALSVGPVAAVAYYDTGSVGSVGLGTRQVGVTATGQAVPPAVPAAMVADVLPAARDTASLQVSATTLDGAVVLLRAVYSGSVEPFGTAARRASVTGYVLGFLRPGDVLRQVYGAPGQQVSLQITSGDTVLVGQAASKPGTFERTLAVGDRQWRLRLSPTADLERIGTSAWVALLIGFLAGFALVGVAVVAVRRDRAARREVERRARGLQFVSELGPLLQSLDLGEVLPAVLVTLADELDCSSIAIALANERGQLVEAFALGDPLPLPDSVAGLPLLPDRAEAGTPVTVSLLRANRSIAALCLQSRRELGELDLVELRATTELLAAAIVNAGLFARERDAVTKLAELDELKTSFIATASHELRTPVTAIQGFTTFLHQQWEQFPDAERRDLIGRIDYHAGFLSELLQDLLDLSQLERGSMVLNLQPVALADFVNGFFARAPQDAEHRFDVVVSGEPWALVDPVALERVFENLVSNAVKYSPVGSVVTITVGGPPDAPTITVDDEGAGIPPDERARVFSRFYRGTGERVTGTRGAGIGLAVVAELVERLDGAITVGVSPAGGARFEVQLRPAEQQVDLEGVAR